MTEAAVTGAVPALACLLCCAPVEPSERRCPGFAQAGIAAPCRLLRRLRHWPGPCRPPPPSRRRDPHHHHHHNHQPVNGGPVMRTPVPWIGLAAIACMFLLPGLDARGLLDGPRTIRRRRRRQVCADCNAPWTPRHQCAGWLEAAVREPVVPLQPTDPPAPPVRVQLTRSDQPAVAPRRRRS